MTVMAMDDLAGARASDNRVTLITTLVQMVLWGVFGIVKFAKPSLPKMKSSDFGPKLAGEVPTRVHANWTKEAIEDVIADVTASIATRRAEEAAFKAQGIGNEIQRVAHARRISQEEAFLRSLQKALEGRK
jgi:hypothetical protein